MQESDTPVEPADDDFDRVEAALTALDADDLDEAERITSGLAEVDAAPADDDAPADHAAAADDGDPTDHGD